MSAAIGIDVGGTNLRAALVAADGTILRRVSQPVERERAAFVPTLAEIARRLGRDEAAAIGVGLPGRVDSAAGLAVSAGYLDIADLPVAAMLQDATGLPVRVENDCGMALLGELAVGAAAGARNVAMLTIGTGIGGAIVSDGRLLRGAGFAGQLGHVAVDPDGEPCKCGRRGCVETTSSGTALARHLRAVGKPSDMTPRDLMAVADAGDGDAALALRQWIVPLRRAIDSLIAAIDPEMVLLGGGLGAAAGQALERVPEGSAWFRRPVRATALGDDAGMVGAAILALETAGGAARQAVAA